MDLKITGNYLRRKKNHISLDDDEAFVLSKPDTNAEESLKFASMSEYSK
jgi:hypothetical protein